MHLCRFFLEVVVVQSSLRLDNDIPRLVPHPGHDGSTSRAGEHGIPLLLALHGSPELLPEVPLHLASLLRWKRSEYLVEGILVLLIDKGHVVDNASFETEQVCQRIDLVDS